LPSVPVEWNEINAAWGQTALLLWCLAKKVGMEFQRYSLYPYGSYSYIKVIADGKVLPLYGSGGFKMIFDSKFDSGMVAFLDCLQQFGLEVTQRNVSFNRS
jgi:beclin 1